MAAQDLTRFNDYVQRMRLADATNLVEVAVRLSIVTLCTFVAMVVLQDILLLLWIGLYIAFTLGYVLVLRRAEPKISAAGYWALIGLHFLIAAWFAALPSYIATRGDPMGLYIGYSAVCGLALHTISRRDMTPHMAISDVGTVVVSGLFVGWQFIFTVPNVQMSVVIAVVGWSLLGYYVHTFVESDRLRRRLEQQAAQERQTQKMRAVGQLTAGIAHDFNNILTVIRGNLDLHDALEDGKERDHVLCEAREASEKAAHLVAQLLAFSRKSRIDPQPRAVGETLDEFLTLARRTLPASTKITIRKPLPKVDIVADPTLLQNALLNAAVNARDAMGPGGGTITLGVDVTDAPPWVGSEPMPQRLYALISLTDTGPGVRSDLLDKLTEPFYTSKPVGQGSGLGLSMIKGFAEQSGGLLHLENASQGGLRLVILLPAEDGSR